MKQIPIGTCVPGQHALKMLPGMKNAGFECFEICFHMEFYGVDIRELAPKVLGELEGTGAKVSAVGLYCNPLAEEEHFRNLCLLIENAKLFGVDKICILCRLRCRQDRGGGHARLQEGLWRAGPSARRTKAFPSPLKTARWAAIGGGPPATWPSRPAPGR